MKTTIAPRGVAIRETNSSFIRAKSGESAARNEHAYSLGSGHRSPRLRTDPARLRAPERLSRLHGWRRRVGRRPCMLTRAAIVRTARIVAPNNVLDAHQSQRPAFGADRLVWHQRGLPGICNREEERQRQQCLIAARPRGGDDPDSVAVVVRSTCSRRFDIDTRTGNPGRG